MTEPNNNEMKLKGTGKETMGVAESFKFLNFLQDVPETEIHLHLEAMINIETILELIEKNKLKDELKIHSENEIYEKFQVDNINDFVQVFYLIQSVFKEEEDFRLLVRDAKQYCKRNNIYYAEIFLAPTKFVMNGLKYDKFIKIINEELMKEYEGHVSDIKLIVDVSRNYGLDNANKILDLVLENKVSSVIGIGMGGAENLPGAEARNYKEVFKRASKNNLQVVAHAGEVTGPELIWETIECLGVTRIGHGISAIYDEKLMDYLKEKQIPLEICPTSNIFTQKYVKEISKHPVREFFDRGLNVTVNCDDPSIFGVELNDEYVNLRKHLGFTVKDIIKLIRNNLYATFMPKEDKDLYWTVVVDEINRLSEVYGIKI